MESQSHNKPTCWLTGDENHVQTRTSEVHGTLAGNADNAASHLEAIATHLKGIWDLQRNTFMSHIHPTFTLI